MISVKNLNLYYDAGKQIRFPGAGRGAKSAPFIRGKEPAPDKLYYESVHALKEVDMEISGPGITALIGPSGCGKSTFLRCLNRMNDGKGNVRTEGSVLLDGKEIYDRSVDVTRLRKKVGMVFQQPNPFPMSIFDNVAYGPRLYGVKDRRRLEEIVEAALWDASVYEELRERWKESALKLSGGQQQRLCIARAIAVKPEVLLLDEPTSALDPASTRKVEEFMERSRKRYTIIVVTHNMQQAARIADDVAFFLDGRLVELGSADSIFKHPRDKRTRDYVTGRFG